MRKPSPMEAVKEAVERIEGYLHVSSDEIQVEYPVTSGLLKSRMDAIVEAGGYTFLIEYRSQGFPGVVSEAIEQLKLLSRSSDKKGQIIPLLVVPFMPDTGRSLCSNSGASWIDLSGNSNIIADGLVVRESGKKNKFVSRGRPENLFSPVSSRVARHMLMHPRSSFSQREISHSTGVDEGYVSKICSRLEEARFIVRGDDRRIRVKDPDILLDAWKEEYDPGDREWIRGHIPARSGTAAMETLVSLLEKDSYGYALTGLAAAWLMTGFTSFRTVSIYLKNSIQLDILESIGFIRTEKGSNLKIVNGSCDEGVFQGLQKWEGVYCVHPIQVYLDLQGQPERSEEAADELRKSLLKWER